MSEKKINLLVITGMFPRYPGSIHGIFVLDYLKSIEEYCNIKVFNIFMSGFKGFTKETINNFPVYRYGMSQKPLGKIIKPFLYIYWFYKGWKIGKTFKETDIIHTHGSTLSGTLALLIARKLKVPVIITEHANPFIKLQKSLLKKYVRKFALEHADVVLTVSEHLKAQILNVGIKPKKVIVTGNPIDVELFNNGENNTDLRNRKNIIFVGRLVGYKGGNRTLLAFKKIVKKYMDWKLTIIGDGPELEEMKSIIDNDELLSDRVILKGRVTKNEIFQEMKKASFFVFPSMHETFGIVVAEAMSSGLPVIVGNTTAPKEFVDEECGLLVLATDINAIADSIEDMIQNIAMYDSERIRDKVVKKYSFPEFGKKILQIYREYIT